MEAAWRAWSRRGRIVAGALDAETDDLVEGPIGGIERSFDFDDVDRASR